MFLQVINVICTMLAIAALLQRRLESIQVSITMGLNDGTSIPEVSKL